MLTISEEKFHHFLTWEAPGSALSERHNKRREERAVLWKRHSCLFHLLLLLFISAFVAGPIQTSMNLEHMETPKSLFVEKDNKL
jgi:hypothetical protein